MIDDSMCDQRLDRFLKKLYKVRSKNSIEKWIRKKLIKVNGKKVKASYRLEVGDELRIFLPDSLLEDSLREMDEILEKKSSIAEKKLNIVFEDEDILVVNKPPGILVHPADGEYTSALSTIVKDYLSSNIGPTFSPASVSRLDFNTQGLVLFGKTYKALKHYNMLVKEGKIGKFYMALCEGIVEGERTVDGYLTKSDRLNKSIFTYDETEGAKYVKTSIRPLERFKDYSLVEVELHTGRSHQIRATLSHMGHPIVGDRKYGAKNKRGLEHQVLVAYKLVLPDRVIEINPDSIKSLINRLQKDE